MSPPPTADPDRPLRRNASFLALLTGYGISSLGDAVSFTAVPLLVLLLTGSGVAMGVVGLLQMLPDLLLGLVLGAYADRLDRRRLMIVADLGRAILTALVPISFALGAPTMGVLLAVVFLIGALRILFLAGYTAAVPKIAGRGRIGQATGTLEAASALGIIVGPAIAGVLSVAIGPAYTLAIDAASFAISALATLFVRVDLRAAAATPRRDLRAEIRESVGFVARQPALRLALAIWSLYTIAVASWPAVMLWYMTIDRGLTTEAFGLVVSSYGAGALIGAAAASRIVRRVVGAPILVGAALTGGLIAASAFLADLPLLIATVWLAGVSELQLTVGYGTLRAAVTPDRLLGRVGSTTRMISVGGQAVGFLIAGILLDAVGGGGTLMAMGLTIMGATVLAAIPPTLRRATIGESSAVPA